MLYTFIFELLLNVKFQLSEKLIHFKFIFVIAVSLKIFKIWAKNIQIFVTLKTFIYF